MTTKTINSLSVPLGDYYLLVPSSCIQELTMAQNYQIKLAKKHYQLGIICWKQLNIPLLIADQSSNSHKQIVSHIVIIKSLFNHNFNYYALACYGIPKMLKITCDNINIAVKTNYQLGKYQFSFEAMHTVIADFKNIELLIASFYQDHQHN